MVDCNMTVCLGKALTWADAFVDKHGVPATSCWKALRSMYAIAVRGFYRSSYSLHMHQYQRCVFVTLQNILLRSTSTDLARQIEVDLPLM